MIITEDEGAAPIRPDEFGALTLDTISKATDINIRTAAGDIKTGARVAGQHVAQLTAEARLQAQRALNKLQARVEAQAKATAEKARAERARIQKIKVQTAKRIIAKAGGPAKFEAQSALKFSLSAGLKLNQAETIAAHALQFFENSKDPKETAHFVQDLVAKVKRGIQIPNLPEVEEQIKDVVQRTAAEIPKIIKSTNGATKINLDTLARLTRKVSNAVQAGRTNIKAFGDLVGIEDLDRALIMQEIFQGDIDWNDPKDKRRVFMSVFAAGVNPQFLLANRTKIENVGGLGLMIALNDVGVPIDYKTAKKMTGLYITIVNGKNPDMSKLSHNELVALGAALVSGGAIPKKLTDQAAAGIARNLKKINRKSDKTKNELDKIKPQIRAIARSEVPAALPPRQPVKIPTRRPTTIVDSLAPGLPPELPPQVADSINAAIASTTPEITAERQEVILRQAQADLQPVTEPPTGAAAFVEKLKQGKMEAVLPVAGVVGGLTLLAILTR